MQILKKILKLFKSDRQLAIDSILNAARKEILTGQVFIEYYKWQKEHLHKDATKEEVGKYDLQIKQAQDIVAKNIVIDVNFRKFLKER